MRNFMHNFLFKITSGMALSLFIGFGILSVQAANTVPELDWQFSGQEENLVADSSGNDRVGYLLRGDYNRRPPASLPDRGRSDGALELRRGKILASTPFKLGNRWSLSFWLQVPEYSGHAAKETQFPLSDLVKVNNHEKWVAGPWYFRPDPQNQGEVKGWHAGGVNSPWTPVPVPAFLSQTAIGGYLGYGWYSTDFNLPPGITENGELKLRFGAVDEQAWVYLNGELIGEHTTASEGKETSDLWNRPFEIRLPLDRLIEGQQNRLVVRTHASGGQHGIIRPVQLRYRDPTATERLVEQFATTFYTPGEWEHIAVVADSEEIKLYRNGVESQTLLIKQGKTSEGFAQLQFVPEQSLTGTMLLDDVRFYNDALPAAKITAMAGGLYHPRADWLSKLDSQLQPLARAGRWSWPLAQEKLPDFRRLGAPDTQSLVAAMASDDISTEDLEMIVWAVGVYQDSRTLAPLIKMVSAPSPQIADGAVKALLEFKRNNILPYHLVTQADDQARAMLARLLRTAPNLELRDMAATGLAMIGDETAVAKLRLIMEEPARQPRFAARRALRQAGLDYSRPSGPEVLRNPYENVEWAKVEQFLANFHSHTVNSDGRAEPKVLINNYAEAGYHILAITDHDNHHTTRPGERSVTPTAETTWPWSDYITQTPARTWQRNGRETAAFYPDLGERGMLAIRGNELTTSPHITSLFNSCGWLAQGEQCDDERLGCVQDQQGLAYWAHASHYLPGGRRGNGGNGEDHNEKWLETARYFGEYIKRYDSLLGIEGTGDEEESMELFDFLLADYYGEHDVFIQFSDDTHSVRVSENAPLTIVLAPELTENAVRYALQNGHKLAGRRATEYPRFNNLKIDQNNSMISLDIENYDVIRWFKNGVQVEQGREYDFSLLEDAVVRFEIELNGITFYSQGLYIW